MKSSLTFGGVKISVSNLPNGDKALEYNDNTVLLSSIKEWIDGPFDIGRLSPTITIKKDGSDVVIGCLRDKKSNFLKIFTNIN